MALFKDHFSNNSDNYKLFRPTYPESLFSWLADLSDQKNSVWDCGTGTGQAAIMHSKYFDHVLATDASEAQIKQAEPMENVTYKVCTAEALDTPTQLFDLITVAQAIHWFDLAEFFKTVERVLKPGGHIAVWGYQFIHTNTELDDLIHHFHSKVVGPYWPPERKLLNEGYTSIDFPYERLSTPQFAMSAQWNMEQLLGYLNTWSAVKKYIEVNGKNPINGIMDELKTYWENSKSPVNVEWPLTIYLGRKPLAT